MAKRKNRNAKTPQPQRAARKWFAPAALELHASNPRRDLPGLLLFAAAVFALYAASTPRTVMLEDDGLFISAAYFAGVAHPPGYPLYTALGWLAAQIPVGSVAFRVHCLSGFMGAITCAAISWIVLRRTGNRPAAYLAGAALALSEHFWSQAIVADVYTLNTALLFGALLCMVEALARRSAPLWFCAAALYGAGLANHWILLGLGTPLLFAPALAGGRAFWRRAPWLLLAALATAALAYGWLVWRSQLQPAPAVNFLGPVNSWNAFVEFIGRNIYSGVDESTAAGITDKLNYAGYFVTQAFWQFSPLGFALALWGLFAALRSRGANGGAQLFVLCEAAALCGSSFLLIAQLGFNYEYFRIAAFRPYPLVAYCVLALWFGYGLHAFMQYTRININLRRFAIPAAAALALAATGAVNGGANFRPNDRFAEEQARALMELAEPNGVLVVYGDAYAFPIAYLHLVQGERPDLTVMEAHGLIYENPVVQSGWSEQRRMQAWRNYFAQLQRPGYFQGMGAQLTNIGQRHLGFLEGVLPGGEPGRMVAAANKTSRAYFQKLLRMPRPKDSWAADHYGILLEIYGNYLGYALALNDAAVNAHIAEVLPQARENYYALLGMAGILALQNAPHNITQAGEYLARAQQLAPAQRNKAQRAKLLYLSGLVEQKSGRAEAARALYLQSINVYNAAENPAHAALQQLRRP